MVNKCETHKRCRCPRVLRTLTNETNFFSSSAEGLRRLVAARDGLSTAPLPKVSLKHRMERSWARRKTTNVGCAVWEDTQTLSKSV